MRLTGCPGIIGTLQSTSRTVRLAWGAILACGPSEAQDFNCMSLPHGQKTDKSNQLNLGGSDLLPCNGIFFFFLSLLFILCYIMCSSHCGDLNVAPPVFCHVCMCSRQDPQQREALALHLTSACMAAALLFEPSRNILPSVTLAWAFLAT